MVSGDPAHAAAVLAIAEDGFPVQIERTTADLAPRPFTTPIQ